MKPTAQELLDLRVGMNTVGENLRRAVDMGRIVETESGAFELPGGSKTNPNWMFVSHGPSLHCNFLMDFMFDHVYAQSAMPVGCSACYKVKVVLRTVRELVAAWQLGTRINCRSKWGTDLNNPYSQNIYAGYFYISGLETARALYEVVRAAFDADAKLGPGVAMTIKRGCSEYEAKLGPSDQYTFTPQMLELEAYLLDNFSEHKSSHQPSLVLAHWIETAFRIGDDTYLDFTGGVRLRSKTVAYDPVALK